MSGLLQFADHHFEQIVDHLHLKDQMRQNVVSIVETAGIVQPSKRKKN